MSGHIKDLKGRICFFWIFLEVIFLLVLSSFDSAKFAFGQEAVVDLLGERYMITRKEHLSETVMAIEWSVSEAKYALEEIYARHGYDFPDPSIKTQFEGFKWYSENIKVGVPALTIQSNFNAFEIGNEVFLRQKLRLFSSSSAAAGDAFPKLRFDLLLQLGVKSDTFGPVHFRPKWPGHTDEPLRWMQVRVPLGESISVVDPTSGPHQSFKKRIEMGSLLLAATLKGDGGSGGGVLLVNVSNLSGGAPLPEFPKEITKENLGHSGDDSGNDLVACLIENDARLFFELSSEEKGKFLGAAYSEFFREQMKRENLVDVGVFLQIGLADHPIQP